MSDQTTAAGCQKLLELLRHLVSEEANCKETYRWLLCWLAYPIQHPGAKMRTAVLMHGPAGAGKSLFFNCILAIYAARACRFGRAELESPFNGWASGKRFAIGEEVTRRAEIYHHGNRLRVLVSEAYWQIHEKHAPARQEVNQCNFVFLTNSIDFAKVDTSDRRYLAISTPEPMPQSWYREVAHEINAGGIEALRNYLEALDLGDFRPDSPPPTARGAS